MLSVPSHRKHACAFTFFPAPHWGSHFGFFYVIFMPLLCRGFKNCSIAFLWPVMRSDCIICILCQGFGIKWPQNLVQLQVTRLGKLFIHTSVITPVWKNSFNSSNLLLFTQNTKLSLSVYVSYGMLLLSHFAYHYCVEVSSVLLKFGNCAENCKKYL